MVLSKKRIIPNIISIVQHIILAADKEIKPPIKEPKTRAMAKIEVHIKSITNAAVKLIFILSVPYAILATNASKDNANTRKILPNNDCSII